MRGIVRRCRAWGFGLDERDQRVLLYRAGLEFAEAAPEALVKVVFDGARRRRRRGRSRPRSSPRHRGRAGASRRRASGVQAPHRGRPGEDPHHRRERAQGPAAARRTATRPETVARDRRAVARRAPRPSRTGRRRRPRRRSSRSRDHDAAVHHDVAHVGRARGVGEVGVRVEHRHRVRLVERAGR